MIQRDFFTRLERDEVVILDAAAWMNARRNFGANRRIGIQCGGEGVSSPAFKKNFASVDRMTGRKIKDIRFFHFSPSRGTKLAKNVVLGRDTLQIEQKMPFTTGRTVVAGAKRFLFSGPEILEEILHFGRRKDEITLEHRAGGSQKSGPCNRQFTV